MKCIADELKRVQTTSLDDPDFHIHQRFQVDMEWWILGKAIEGLKIVGIEVPVYAEKRQEVDFITYNAKGEIFCPIEISEALEPGRERVNEYREAKQRSNEAPLLGKLIEPIPDPWITLKDILRKKYAKIYPTRTWLIVYYDISYAKISEYGWWHSTILANAKDWNVEKAPFERVLIMDATGKAMVQFSPKLEVIKVEKML
jgi:hypothetical protein